jgi:two-component system, NarL family, sensor histidine kinase DegS
MNCAGLEKELRGLLEAVLRENTKPMRDSLDVLDISDTAVVLEASAARLVQEAERRRIARDLHDGVVQTLTALVADLEYFRTRSLPSRDSQIVQKVETWQSLAREGLDSIRQALGSLRAANGASTSFDLLHMIEALLNGLQDEGYSIEFECPDWPAELPGAYTAQLFSIVREALVNISKHADATRITVALFHLESSLFLSIADDGKGMTQLAQMEATTRGYHQGLIGMRERAALLGGRLTLESIPGRGTRIDIEIPWEFRTKSII